MPTNFDARHMGFDSWYTHELVDIGKRIAWALGNSNLLNGWTAEDRLFNERTMNSILKEAERRGIISPEGLPGGVLIEPVTERERLLGRTGAESERAVLRWLKDGR